MNLSNRPAILVMSIAVFSSLLSEIRIGVEFRSWSGKFSSA